MGFSLALLGAGYLVGLTGGIAILLGISIAWGIAVPYFSSHIPQPADMEMAAFAMKLWKEKVRFIGAGTIGIAAVWTLLMLLADARGSENVVQEWRRRARCGTRRTGFVT